MSDERAGASRPVFLRIDADQIHCLLSKEIIHLGTDVLIEPGLTAGTAIGSKTHQYVTQNLRGAMQTDGWFYDGESMVFPWTLDDAAPRSAP